MDPAFLFVVLDVSVSLLSETVRAYFITRLLDIRSPKLFWTSFFFAIYPSAALLRLVIPEQMVALRVLMAFAIYYFVWPMAMSTGSLRSRCVVCVVLIVQTFACEIGASVVYHALTGFATVSYVNYVANPLGYDLTRLAHLLMTIAVLVAIEFVLRRMHFGKFKEPHVQGERIDVGVSSPIAFMALQAVSLVGVVAYQSRAANGDYLAVSADPVLGVFALAILLLDFALILAIQRYLESTRELGRAVAMQRLRDEEIASYASVVAQVEETAKLRHDLRNHLQMVYALRERGETELAAQYYAAMSEMLSAIDQNPALSPEDDMNCVVDSEVGLTQSQTLRAICDGNRGGHSTSPFMSWVPWSPVVFQAGFAAYIALRYMVGSTSPAFLCLMTVLLVAGMVAAVWLKRSLEVSMELEANRFRAHVLAIQVEAQRERAAFLASQQKEAVEIRRRIANELDALAESAEGSGQTDADTYDRAFAAVELLDVSRRWSQNLVVDAIVATKARQFDDAGVELVAHLDVPRETGLPSTALCAAFANMLDNALAAAGRVVENGEEAIVEVRAHVKNGFLVITARNPVAADSGSAPEERNCNAVGAEISEHGWGLDILQSLADYYGGDFTFEISDGVAVTTLVLNLQAQQ